MLGCFLSSFSHATNHATSSPSSKNEVQYVGVNVAPSSSNAGPSTSRNQDDRLEGFYHPSIDDLVSAAPAWKEFKKKDKTSKKKKKSWHNAKREILDWISEQLESWRNNNKEPPEDLLDDSMPTMEDSKPAAEPRYKYETPGSYKEQRDTPKEPKAKKPAAQTGKHGDELLERKPPAMAKTAIRRSHKKHRKTPQDPKPKQPAVALTKKHALEPHQQAQGHFKKPRKQQTESTKSPEEQTKDTARAFASMKHTLEPHQQDQGHNKNPRKSPEDAKPSAVARKQETETAKSPEELPAVGLLDTTRACASVTHRQKTTLIGKKDAKLCLVFQTPEPDAEAKYQTPQAPRQPPAVARIHGNHNLHWTPPEMPQELLVPSISSLSGSSTESSELGMDGARRRWSHDPPPMAPPRNLSQIFHTPSTASGSGVTTGDSLTVAATSTIAAASTLPSIDSSGFARRNLTQALNFPARETRAAMTGDQPNTPSLTSGSHTATPQAEPTPVATTAAGILVSMGAAMTNNQVATGPSSAAPGSHAATGTPSTPSGPTSSTALPAEQELNVPSVVTAATSVEDCKSAEGTPNATSAADTPSSITGNTPTRQPIVSALMSRWFTRPDGVRVVQTITVLTDEVIMVGANDGTGQVHSESSNAATAIDRQEAEGPDPANHA